MYNQNIIKFLVSQKNMFSKIYIYLCILFIYMYTKAFVVCLIKAWERISGKKRDGEVGKQKLSKMGGLNIK